MNRPLSFKVALFGVLIITQAAFTVRAGEEGNDARQWLSRMSQAVRSLNYEGTFVYRRGEALVGMSVTHVVDTQGERERLVTLNGVRREVIRDHNGVTCILPDQNLVVVSKGRLEKPFPTKLLEDPKVIAAHYDISDAGLSRTMGRDAQVISIKPHDRYRYGYRVWIDPKTGLMLQSDVVNKDGKIMEQIMFTSLHLLDKVPSSIEDEVHPAINTILKSNQTAATGDNQWLVTHMPDGFRLIEHRKRTRQSDNHAVSMDHLVLTDGLASVSVFIENQLMPHQTAPMVGVSRLGAVNAYRTVVGNHQVTVVGEVPVSTVQLIGESVSYHVTH
jgi:sigma-E factor negative regulatory protein RseB